MDINYVERINENGDVETLAQFAVEGSPQEISVTPEMHNNAMSKINNSYNSVMSYEDAMSENEKEIADLEQEIKELEEKIQNVNEANASLLMNIEEERSLIRSYVGNGAFRRNLLPEIVDFADEDSEEE